MKTAVAIASEEDFYTVSNLPPSRTQKRLALAVVLFTSGVAFVVIGPLSGVRLRPVAAFLPMYLMAMFVIELADRDSPVRTIRHFTLVCDARTRQRIRLHCDNSDPI